MVSVENPVVHTQKFSHPIQSSLGERGQFCVRPSPSPSVSLLASTLGVFLNEVAFVHCLLCVK